MGEIEDYIKSESSFKSILLLFDWNHLQGLISCLYIHIGGW